LNSAAIRSVQNFSLIIVSLAYLLIYFAPRLSGNFRYEDLLYPFMIIAILLLPLSNLLNNFKWIIFFSMIYVAYILLTAIINISFNGLHTGAFIFLNKEIQYLILFCLTLFSIFDQHNLHRFILLLKGILLAGALWIILSYSGDIVGYYGLTWVNETSPSLSGLIIISLLFLSFILHHDGAISKSYFYLFIILFLLGILATGSRSTQLATFIGLVYLFYDRLSYSNKFLMLFFFFLSLVPIIFFRFELYELLYNFESGLDVLDGGVNRLGTLFKLFETLQSSRTYSVMTLINEINQNNLFFGCGRGCSHGVANNIFSYAVARDNGYLANILELGIVGTALFFSILLGIYIKTSGFYRTVWLSLTLVYLLYSFTAEVWLITKGAQLYWLISAICLIKSGHENAKIYK